MRAWPQLAVVVCSVPLLAQTLTSRFEGTPVARVEFEPEIQPVPLPELDELLLLRPAKLFRSEDASQTIERIYATGRYDDLEVHADMEDGGLVVRILTQARWFIGLVKVEGVAPPPNAGQLTNATKLDLGMVFSEEDLRQAVANIRDDLMRNGYFEHEIETDVTREPRTQEVYIRFRIRTQERPAYSMPEVTGDPQRSREQVAAGTGWKGWFGWKKVTDARTQEGMDRLQRAYVKQGNLMADVELLDMKHDGPAATTATPVLRVDAGPSVKLELEGEGVSEKRARRLIPVYEEYSVDRDLLMEGARNMEEDLQAKGYFDADVSFKQESAPGGDSVIRYTIDRGPRGELVHIGIRGNQYFDEPTIRERMAIAVASWQVRKGRFSRSLLERDLEAIRELYRSNGFRDVEVDAEVIRNYQDRAGENAVMVEIREGPQWMVARLDLEGIQSLERERIVELISSTEGQVFSGLNVSIDRDNILAYYYQEGFNDASLEWSFEPAAEPYRVNLRYIITENKRRFLRAVLINGLDATRESAVRKRIRLFPGDPLSATRVLETQQRLYAMGVFSRVDVATQNPLGDERSKYLVFAFDEARRNSISYGFGAEFSRIGTEDQPGGEAAFIPRFTFDYTRLNVWGVGHTASLKTRVSSLQQRVLLDYIAPRPAGKEKLNLSVTGLFDDSRNVQTYSSRRWEASTQITHSISRIYTAFYQYSYRYVTVSDVQVDPDLIPLASQPTRVGMISGSLIQDRRDDPVNSTRGSYNTIDIGLAFRFLGSESDFSRVLFRNTTYHRLSPRFILARSLNLGWMHAVTPLPPDDDPTTEDLDIPLPERLFAGGASTHRAFPENQAGPRDLVTGFPVGGKALLIHGTELRFPVTGKNFGAVLFWDAGNIYSSVSNVSLRYNQRDPTDFDYMVHAVGLGIRYNTPIGPIRLDLAFGLNSPEFNVTQDDGTVKLDRIRFFQFHFSLGQTF